MTHFFVYEDGGFTDIADDEVVGLMIVAVEFSDVYVCEPEAYEDAELDYREGS